MEISFYAKYCNINNSQLQFYGMNWKFVCLLTILLIVFGFPVISGIRLPKDCSAEQVGDFLGQILAYWEEVVTRIMQKFEFQFLSIER